MVKLAYIKYKHYICINKEEESMATKSRRYSVSLAPSGWAVYDEQTNMKVKGFSCLRGGRIQALELMYQLNGWNLPKSGLR